MLVQMLKFVVVPRSPFAVFAHWTINCVFRLLFLDSMFQPRREKLVELAGGGGELVLCFVSVYLKTH